MLETDFVTTLKTVAARVHPDVAPAGDLLPHVIWQSIGGKPVRFLDNTPGDNEHAMVQVWCWASTRLAARMLARNVEDALTAATAFIATPDTQPIADVTDAPGEVRYGYRQDFSVWAPRT